MLQLNRLVRRAFTLLELLVVIVIIGVLLGLLLGAVQRVREAAARAACQNNLRQLGLAVHGYHDAHGFLPPSRIEDAWATWAVLILPHLEQEAAFKSWDLSRRYHEQPDAARLVRVPGFYCPSRRSPNGPSQGSADARSLPPAFPHAPGEVSDYAVCGGSGFADNEMVDTKGAFIRSSALWSTFRDDPACRVTRWTGTITLNHITDGLGNTLFLGDKHIRPGKFLTTLEDSAVFNGDHTYGYVRYAGTQADTSDARPLASGTDSTKSAQRFGSWHPGVCQFLFGDGSVRGIQNNASLDLLTRLADRADGLPIGDF